MRVLTIRLGYTPAVEELNGHDILKSCQEVVGGYVEAVALGGDVSILCNEDGMSLGLLPNACGFLGNVICIANDSQTDDWRGLTDTEIALCRDWICRHWLDRHPGNVAELTAFDMDQTVRKLQALGCTPSHLEVAVIDLKEQEAAAILAQGLEAAVAYLMGTCRCTSEDVVKEAVRSKTIRGD